MKRRSRCFTNYAPVLCVRSVIRLAISTQLRWMNRSWAGVQKVKGMAFTIRQSSLVRLRYVPERLPLRGARRTFYAGRLRLRLVPNREAKSLTKFVRENVAKGAVVHTDGWTGYDGLEALGYVHKPLVIDGDPERIDSHFPMIHIAFSESQVMVARNPPRR